MDAITGIVFKGIFCTFIVELFLLPKGLVAKKAANVNLMIGRFAKTSVSKFILTFGVIVLVIKIVFLNGGFTLAAVLDSFACPVTLRTTGRVFTGLIVASGPVLGAVFTKLKVKVKLNVMVQAKTSAKNVSVPPLVLGGCFQVPISIDLGMFSVLVLLPRVLCGPPRHILCKVLLMVVCAAILSGILIVKGAGARIGVVDGRIRRMHRTVLTRMSENIAVLCKRNNCGRRRGRVMLDVISGQRLPRIRGLVERVSPRTFVVVDEIARMQKEKFSLDGRCKRRRSY